MICNVEKLLWVLFQDVQAKGQAILIWPTWRVEASIKLKWVNWWGHNYFQKVKQTSKQHTYLLRYTTYSFCWVIDPGQHIKNAAYKCIINLFSSIVSPHTTKWSVRWTTRAHTRLAVVRQNAHFVRSNPEIIIKERLLWLPTWNDMFCVFPSILLPVCPQPRC